MDKTFYIIKPEAFNQRDNIRKDILNSGLSITESKILALSSSDTAHLSVQDMLYTKDKKLSQAYDYFLRQGLVEVGVISGSDVISKFKDVCGSHYDPCECPLNTLRSKYGHFESSFYQDREFYLNGVHKSSNEIEASYELDYYYEVLKFRTLEQSISELAQRYYTQIIDVNPNSEYVSELETLWSCHVLPVVKYCKIISDRVQHDPKISVISGYFHDIGRITQDTREDHEQLSINLLNDYLFQLGALDTTISQVETTIRNHRSNITQRIDLDSKILASADGIANINYLPLLFYSAYRKHQLPIVSGFFKVKDKMDRSWSKIVPEFRDLAVDNYTLFNSMLTRFD